MLQHVILVGLAAFLGVVVGCGSSDGGSGGVGVGGEAGSGGAGGTGEAGTGGGEGGAGGEPVPTPLMDRTEAGLAFQLECCQCQTQDQCHDLETPISESACLALAPELPFSDRQNECFDAVILGEEFMTLQVRFECLVDVDLDAADCLSQVNECSETAIADCLDMRTMGQQACPNPNDDVLPMLSECQATTVEDGVDAFLDSRSARCDCLPNCTPIDPDQETMECMVNTLQAALDMLDPVDRAVGLRCITKFWRQTAVCFGNEVDCEGPVTACADLPLMVCAIDGAVLDDCLVL